MYRTTKRKAGEKKKKFFEALRTQAGGEAINPKGRACLTKIKNTSEKKGATKSRACIAEAKGVFKQEGQRKKGGRTRRKLVLHGAQRGKNAQSKPRALRSRKTNRFFSPEDNTPRLCHGGSWCGERGHIRRRKSGQREHKAIDERVTKRRPDKKTQKKKKHHETKKKKRSPRPSEGGGNLGQKRIGRCRLNKSWEILEREE